MPVRRGFLLILVISLALLAVRNDVAQAGLLAGGSIDPTWFRISPLHVGPGPDEIYSAVAYNSQQQEYLVVWERDYSGGTKEVYEQRVSKNGALVGSAYGVAAPGGIYQHPDVAYNSQLNEYLIVWVAGAVGVYGQRVEADGEP